MVLIRCGEKTNCYTKVFVLPVSKQIPYWRKLLYSNFPFLYGCYLLMSSYSFARCLLYSNLFIYLSILCSFFHFSMEKICYEGKNPLSTYANFTLILQYLTTWPLGDGRVILLMHILYSSQELVYWALAMKLALFECHRTPLMRSQHRFR